MLVVIKMFFEGHTHSKLHEWCLSQHDLSSPIPYVFVYASMMYSYS